MLNVVENLQVKTLAAVSRMLDQALDLERTLSEVLRILSDTLSMKRATITLMDRDTGQLAINASFGLTPEEESRGVYRLDEGVTGRIFQTAQPYYVPDIRKEPLFLDKTGSRRIEKGRVSFVGVPILLHGEPIGVLNVDRLFDDDVSYQEDVDFLMVVATLIAQFISLGEQVRKREQVLKQENASLKYELSKTSKKPYIVGKSLSMQDVQRQIQKVAPTRATVLLLGESGAGKTLIGRIIHELSDRRAYSFSKINCASIPENLLESELFGYEKGAFTGATGSRPGRFEDAHKGTLFLDEIGELPLGIQAKLLRVLQDKEFERLGSNTTRKADVRILAATNRKLDELVEAGAFRADLYYRLNVFPIRVPSLRERKEDIPSLIIHFLDKVSREYGRTLRFTDRALRLCSGYDWPGNVREMENLVERLVIMADQERIDSEMIRPFLDLSTKSEPAQGPGAEAGKAREDHTTSLREMEKNEVLAALRRNDWIQQRAARDLGLTPRQMGYRVKKFGLDIIVAARKAEARRERQSQPHHRA